MAFAGLEVGDAFRSRTVVLTEEAIIAFATEFDPQPFHLDADAAAGSFFGGLAGSGWHIASLTMRLLVETVPIASGLIGTEVQVAWPTPSRPGDELHVDAVITEITPSASRQDRARVVLESETLTADGAVRERLRATMLVTDRTGSQPV